MSVLHRVPLLPPPCQGLPGLTLGGAPLLQPAVQLPQLLAHRLVPVQHLLSGSRQGGEQGLGLGGGGRLHGLLLPQFLQLPCQGPGRLGRLLGLLALAPQLLPHPSQLVLDFGQPLLPLADLAPQAVRRPSCWSRSARMR